MTKNMSRSRKAISPILATLLLIVIAVAAIVVTYAWIMTYMGSAGREASVMLYKENIRFYGAANHLTDVTIGNSGTSDTKILRIYMGNTSGNMVEMTNYTNIDGGRLLNADSAETITVTWTNSPLAASWESGKNYYFTIIPSAGAPLEKIPEQAPQ